MGYASSLLLPDENIMLLEKVDKLEAYPTSNQQTAGKKSRRSLPGHPCLINENNPFVQFIKGVGIR